MKKKIFKMILIILTTVACFLIGREYALYERGYKAVGGEYIILILPAIAYLIKEALKDYKEIRNSECGIEVETSTEVSIKQGSRCEANEVRCNGIEEEQGSRWNFCIYAETELSGLCDDDTREP